MILDTTIIIDIIKNDHSAVQKLLELEKQNENVCITAISIFEVLQGVRSRFGAKQEQQTRKILQRFSTLVFDTASAVESGNIGRQLYESGQPIEDTDCMIAGIAKTHNETILTRNQKHFSRIPGLTVETY